MNPGRPLAALALLFTALCAFGQSYPKGPVRMIVPFPAGGGVDAAARILGQKLAEGSGKPFVIENRGGANGNIGTEAAAKSANDGATILFTGAGFVTNPSLYKSVPYDPVKDFEPVSLMALGPNVLVVHPSLPVKSVRELIALARTQPGRIGFAGSGSGSTPHLAGELFNAMAGVQMVHIPYRGSGPAMIGLLAPAGTQSEVLDLLNLQVANIMRSSDMKIRMTNDGLVPIGGSREQFAAHIKGEIEKWAKVVSASGARVD